MTNGEVYHRLVDSAKGETALLFQRLNYFLITTAFLVASFVAAYSGSRSSHSHSLLVISYVLIATGILLSVSYSHLNRIMSRIIARMAEMISWFEGQEALDDKFFDKRVEVCHQPQAELNKIAKDVVEESNPWLPRHVFSLHDWRHWVVLDILVEAWSAFRVYGYRQKDGQSGAENDDFKRCFKTMGMHTYLVPFGFLGVWLVLFGVVLACNWRWF